jgi:ABC-2 type transport system permease protein
MSALVRAELRKLFTTRLWLWMLLTAIALTALFASLGIAFADDPDNTSPPLDTPEGQRNILGSASTAALIIGILGVIAMTSEYRHQTVTPTFLATPRRGRVVAAKMITYALVGVLYSAACTAVALAVALPWLAAKDIDVSLGSNGIPQTLLGVGAEVAIYAVLGVGLGALLKNQIAAVVGLLVYSLIVGPILSAIGAIRDYTKYLPDQAGTALIQATPSEDAELLTQWLGGLVLVGWAVLFATIGYFLAVRRDVT